MRTEAAQAASMIRKILANNFPGVSFRVTSKNYSMGDHVNVSWTNGPKQDDVERFISSFEKGTFDGMTDSYIYDNSRDDIPQTKYLMCDRNISDDVLMQGFEISKRRLGWFEGVVGLEDNIKSNGYNNIARYDVLKNLRKMDLREPVTEERFMEAVRS